MEKTLQAKLENLPEMTEFASGVLEEAGASMKVVMNFDVAIDELFSNICHYAYDGEPGMVTMQVDVQDHMAEVCFIDRGKPYNPLEKEDPDVTLSAQDREIGGLGIFLVKKLMDEMEYRYEDGKNILTVRKKLS